MLQTGQTAHADPCSPPTMSIRSGAWSNGRWRPSLMNHNFFYIMWIFILSFSHHLPGEEIEPGCTKKTMKASRWRWCETLVSALRGILGSWHLCGYWFDMYHLQKHFEDQVHGKSMAVSSFNKMSHYKNRTGMI